MLKVEKFIFRLSYIYELFAITFFNSSLFYLQLKYLLLTLVT